MADDLRITVDELRPRIAAGEEFTIIDARSPAAWAQATDMARGAIWVPADALEQSLPRVPRAKAVLVYCT